MPGCSGGPVVTNARAYYTTRAAAGASAPGIPHALKGRNVHAQLGRIAPRDRGAVSCRHCEARLVRRSSTSEGGSDAAMTVSKMSRRPPELMTPKRTASVLSLLFSDQRRQGKRHERTRVEQHLRLAPRRR